MSASILALDEALTHPTLPVPVAGQVFFGLSRNASYEAAKRGDFEVIRIGGKLVVPVAPIAARLGLQMRIGAAGPAGDGKPDHDQRPERPAE